MNYEGMNYIEDLIEKCEEALVRAAFTGEDQHIRVTAWDITVKADLSEVIWKRRAPRLSV